MHNLILRSLDSFLLFYSDNSYKSQWILLNECINIYIFSRLKLKNSVSPNIGKD